MKWMKPINLPRERREVGGHKVTCLYFIVVQNQIVPDVFSYIAERGMFCSNGLEYKLPQVQACAEFNDPLFPKWLHKRGIETYEEFAGDREFSEKD